jgi:hypothetical protein
VEDRPVLDQLNLVVKNMAEMAAFYEHLGLDLAQSPPGWAAHHRNTEPAPCLHLDLDSPEFAATWNAGWPADQHGVVIGFASQLATVSMPCSTDWSMQVTGCSNRPTTPFSAAAMQWSATLTAMQSG